MFNTMFKFCITTAVLVAINPIYAADKSMPFGEKAFEFTKLLWRCAPRRVIIKCRHWQDIWPRNLKRVVSER